MKNAVKYVKGAATILAAMTAPFGAYALAETSLKAAIVLALIAGLGALHTWLDQAFSETSDPVEAALPHAEAHSGSQHPDSKPAAAPDPDDVKEGSV